MQVSFLNEKLALVCDCFVNNNHQFILLKIQLNTFFLVRRKTYQVICNSSVRNNKMWYNVMGVVLMLN